MGDQAMAIHNPPHPGDIIREDCLAPLGLSVTAAAEWLGVSRQSLSELLNGHNGVSAEMAIRLERPGGAPHARGSEHKSPTILPRPDRRQSTSSPIRNPPHHNDGNHRQANIATRLILHKLRQVLHEQ